MSYKYDFGIIGCGNMGGAILSGVLSAGIYKEERVICSRQSPEGIERLKREFPGILATGDNREVASNSRIILLGVKPHMVEGVATGISRELSSDQIVISVAAGLTADYLNDVLTKSETSLKIVRTMPNTAAKAGESMTAYCTNGTLSDRELNEVITLLGSFGRVKELPENLMDAATGVGGSSPAFAYMFMEAMADAAVAEGLPRKLSYEFAAQAVLGAAKMMLEGDMGPGDLKDSICSPKGTTIEGVYELEKGAFRGTVMKAVRATIDKTRKLNEK